MDAIAFQPRSSPQLAAYHWAGPVDQHKVVCLGRQSQRGKPRYLCIIVGPHRIAVYRCGPEAGEGGGMICIDDDFPEPAHRIRFLGNEDR
jgi:hypothetical protein